MKSSSTPHAYNDSVIYSKRKKHHYINEQEGSNIELIATSVMYMHGRKEELSMNWNNNGNAIDICTYRQTDE